MAELQVARPAVRDQHPIVELQDRVGRLHRVTHQLTRQDWVGVCTLADLAVAGILLNEAAAKALRAGAPTDVPTLSPRGWALRGWRRGVARGPRADPGFCALRPLR